MDQIFNKSDVELKNDVIDGQGYLKSLDIPDEVDEPVVDVRAAYGMKFNNSCQPLPSCGVGEGEFIDEPIVDVRAAHVLKGENGAEAFFCDETECLIQKGKQLVNAGLCSSFDNQIDKVIEERIERVNNSRNQITALESQIKKHQKNLDNDKTALATLLIELGYANIKFVANGSESSLGITYPEDTRQNEYVTATKNGKKYRYPRR